MMGNVSFLAGQRQGTKPIAELCYAIIEQARRDAMEIYAKTRRHNTANCGSPTEAAKQSAIAYFRDRGYVGHAAIARIGEHTMERIRTAVLETAAGIRPAVLATERSAKHGEGKG